MSALPFMAELRRLIDRDALDPALALIQNVVDRIFCEPLNVAQVFGAADLDACCQEIGARQLRLMGGAEASHGGGPAPATPSGDLAVYLVSRMQASGGHAAALADVIRLSGTHRALVLVTGTCGPSSRAAVQARFGPSAQVAVEFVPPGSHVRKLAWLLVRLRDLRPRLLWLFNHHQDSVAIAAAQPGLGFRVRYYHHGDHHLCLGVHLPHAEHFDPHPMGFHNCRHALGLANNRYLPLTVPDLGVEPASAPRSGPLVTCTAAGFNKVEVPYFVRYADLLPGILRATGGRHVHIGRLTPAALRTIRHGMRRAGVPASAFIYLPYVPSVWKALHAHAVDLYLASFPYGGGRTLIEVMGAGVPAVVHSHAASRMLGGADLAYPEAFVWRNPEALLSHLAALQRDTLHSEGARARRWYEAHHSEEVARAILAGDTAGPQVPALRAGFAPDDLLQAWHNSGQVTARGALYRLALRNYRRARAWIGRRL